MSSEQRSGQETSRHRYGKDSYLMLNTVDQSSLKQTNQRIKEAHDKIFEHEPESGKVKRVKFESPQLKYNLSEFFENVPTFTE